MSYVDRYIAIIRLYFCTDKEARNILYAKDNDNGQIK